MFRRVLCGLAVVGMIGSVAFGGPTIVVTDNVSTSTDANFIRTFSPEAPSVPGSFQKGTTSRFYFFLKDLDQGMTPDGPVVNTIVAAFGFHLEESGESLSFNSPPTIRFAQQNTFFPPIFDTWASIIAPGDGTDISDTNLDPDIDGERDFGWSRFTWGNPPPIGSSTQFLGFLDVSFADVGDPNHNADPEAWVLNLLPDESKRDPSSSSITQTLVVDDGSLPGDVVTNVSFEGLVGVPLVPEPTTMALLLAGCGGFFARRRRS